jgi:hypothetical protein
MILQKTPAEYGGSFFSFALVRAARNRLLILWNSLCVVK